jgi:hypothetical protein
MVLLSMMILNRGTARGVTSRSHLFSIIDMPSLWFWNSSSPYYDILDHFGRVMFCKIRMFVRRLLLIEKKGCLNTGMHLKRIRQLLVQSTIPRASNFFQRTLSLVFRVKIIILF